MKKQFRNFDDARKFVHSLKLKNQKDWYDYRKSGQKTDDIPTRPNATYKNKGWKGYGDWLGINRIANQNRTYRPYKEAKEFVRKLGLKNYLDWNKYCKSGEKPDDIPANLVGTYKNKGWISIGDFLGTGKIADKNRIYRPYKEAKEFVRKLGLKNYLDWEQYCKSGNKPNDIPANPNGTYKNKGWKGYGDWLGTNRIANQTISKNYLQFKVSREIARELAKKYNLKNWEDWNKAVKEGKIPKNIPMLPNRVYSKKRKNEKTR